MATLLQSGINVLESMEITSRTLGNKYLERRLYDARNDIRKGVPLSRSIRGIEEFPPMICAMVAIGEESGTLDTILDRSADFFEDEADSAIAKMTAAMPQPLRLALLMELMSDVKKNGSKWSIPLHFFKDVDQAADALLYLDE